MFNVDKVYSNSGYFPPTHNLTQVDFSKAKEAYKEAIRDPQERHAEVGILTANGTQTFCRLGKDEEYGAHRVGSVTKTFTTFLALKLAKEGILSLEAKCGDVISHEIISQVFKNPEAAKKMTLEQLLSHTSGLELDNHGREQKAESPSSLKERFLQEALEGRKYEHVSEPGENISFYSNAGLAVAGWMMETAYNDIKGGEWVPFSQIMKEELFEEVFSLENSFIGPGPQGDVISSSSGDMTSSVSDLMKVAARLQEGEVSLAHVFGDGWQALMLKPRDLFKEHGLGCSANATVIQHAGMNQENFGSEKRDVTALVQFPLHPGEPGLIAMCDSSALGPEPQGQKFIRALEDCAGISKQEQQESKYDLEFFCPEQAFLFHGDAYLATNVDPFAEDAPKIICSRNGMRHELQRDSDFDGVGICGYHDENKKPWLFISKDNGDKIIYSDLCLLNKKIDLPSLASKQPDVASVQALAGTYYDEAWPKEDHPIYTFTEKAGHLYLQEDKGEIYPCIFIPENSNSGSWVVSNTSGRKIKIEFPENPDEGYLVIKNILTGELEPPQKSKRKA